MVRSLRRLYDGVGRYGERSEEEVTVFNIIVGCIVAASVLALMLEVIFRDYDED